jgi:hypothetical protein
VKGLDDNETLSAVIDEHRVPVPVNTAYCPTCGDPSKYLVDALRYTYIEPHPDPPFTVRRVLETDETVAVCKSTPLGSGIGAPVATGIGVAVMGAGEGEGEGEATICLTDVAVILPELSVPVPTTSTFSPTNGAGPVTTGDGSGDFDRVAVDGDQALRGGSGAGRRGKRTASAAAAASCQREDKKKSERDVKTRRKCRKHSVEPFNQKGGSTQSLSAR